MATNGSRKPSEPARASGGADRRLPRIEIASSTASDSEAAAIVAALEQFLADMTPAPSATGPPVSAWQRAALEEGVSARQVSVGGLGPQPASGTNRIELFQGPGKTPARAGGARR